MLSICIIDGMLDVLIMVGFYFYFFAVDLIVY
jgi:hypothetical protein